MIENPILEQAIYSLLADENGVSTESYGLLLEAGVIPRWISDYTDGTDDRIYLPEDFTLPDHFTPAIPLEDR